MSVNDKSELLSETHDYINNTIQKLWHFRIRILLSYRF